MRKKRTKPTAQKEQGATDNASTFVDTPPFSMIFVDIIKKAINHNNLSNEGLRVFLYIVCSMEYRNQKVNINQEEAARSLSISQTGISRGLAELIGFNMIKKLHRSSRSTMYSVNSHCAWTNDIAKNPKARTKDEYPVFPYVVGQDDLLPKKKKKAS